MMKIASLLLIWLAYQPTPRRTAAHGRDARATGVAAYRGHGRDARATFAEESSPADHVTHAMVDETPPYLLLCVGLND